MKTLNSRLTKICGVVLSIMLISSIIHAAPVYNYYPPGNPESSNLLRNYDDDGSIYEYYNEDLWPGDPLKNYGKLILAFKLDTPRGPSYDTWDWDTLVGEGQIIVQTYDGVYAPVSGSPAWQDDPAWLPLHEPNRRVTYVYDHHGEINDTTLWTEREKTLYADDGVTVTNKYFSDTTSRLIKEVDVAARMYSVYSYFTNPLYEDLVQYKWEYSFDELDMDEVLTGDPSAGVINLEAIYEYEAYEPIPAAGYEIRAIKEIHPIAIGYHAANTY